MQELHSPCLRRPNDHFGKLSLRQAEVGIFLMHALDYFGHIQGSAQRTGQAVENGFVNGSRLLVVVGELRGHFVRPCPLRREHSRVSQPSAAFGVEPTIGRVWAQSVQIASFRFEKSHYDECSLR